MASMNQVKATLATSIKKLSAISNTDQTNDHDVRTAAVNAAMELVVNLWGPEEALLHLSYASVDSANIAVLVRFEIAQNVPATGTIAVEDLASKIGLPVDIVTRIVRYSIGNGVFCEPTVGHFAHTKFSAYLAENEHVRDIASIATGELAIMNLHMADALSQQKSNDGKGPVAGFNFAYPDFPNAFAFIGADPIRGQRYHKYQAGRTQLPMWDVRGLLDSWNWAEKIGHGTFVDLGGSSGHTSFALAPICPEAKFIVQDVDKNGLEQGRQRLAKTNPNIAQRVEFVEHDLFTPNPTTADVYMFRHVLHDWSDEDVIRIVENLVPALKSGARVLVSEGIMPTDAAQPTVALSEKQIRLEDIFMLAVHGAKERSVEEFVDLFHKASKNFQLVGVTGGCNGTFQSLIELQYV